MIGIITRPSSVPYRRESRYDDLVKNHASPPLAGGD